ncbi:MAG TPA: hypothetical protein PLG34_10725 [Spirochaetota bacterium]|jgi:hypothetical protein|nr:MAG: hypothetical protein BWX91_02442 [Spirochaetes bacterium ADurb.Bin133]HNZ26977.1 hypothetical protein [Spirochaetota bacterium]HPY88441.1 hypothetical protein [Spirochaetota bacterium]HQB61449.1 hypothetical protein [Spirochaetota bacterium]
MIKKGNDKKRTVDSKTRVQLIRKGNEFFTEGNIPAAEKIFLTTDYKDGLVRLGDYYMGKSDIEKACDMYFKSENSSKIEEFCKYSAKVIQKWLKDDDDDAVVDKIIITK